VLVPTTNHEEGNASSGRFKARATIIMSYYSYRQRKKGESWGELANSRIQTLLKAGVNKESEEGSLQQKREEGLGGHSTNF